MSKVQDIDAFEFEGSSLESQARCFAQMFGVKINYDDGYITGEYNIVGFYFDMSKDVTAKETLENTTEPAVESHAHGHNRGSAITFKTDTGRTTTITKEKVHKIERLFGVDIQENIEYVKLNKEKENYPVKITDPRSDRFVAIAPRVMAN